MGGRLPGGCGYGPRVASEHDGDLDLRPIRAAIVSGDDLRLRRTCKTHLLALLSEVELLREERDRLEAEIAQLRAE